MKLNQTTVTLLLHQQRRNLPLIPFLCQEKKFSSTDPIASTGDEAKTNNSSSVVQEDTKRSSMSSNLYLKSASSKKTSLNLLLQQLLCPTTTATLLFPFVLIHGLPPGLTIFVMMVILQLCIDQTQKQIRQSHSEGISPKKMFYFQIKTKINSFVLIHFVCLIKHFVFWT